MISAEFKHKKHAKLAKPALGEFGRHELAFLGAPCAVIKQLFDALIIALPQFKIAVVDADHKAADTENPASLTYTDRITSRIFEFQQNINQFQNRVMFNGQDLVLINGNHFSAKSQVIIIDDAKPLNHKLNLLTDVRLILVKDEYAEIPQYLKEYLNDKAPYLQPVAINRITEIADFISNFIQLNMPPLNGLVLAGGDSLRMQTDKASINYHGKSQRAHVFGQLTAVCDEVFVSVKDHQQDSENLPAIPDRFIGLGPYGGILSAMQTNPDAAWLTIACDLPYLTERTLNYLTEHRNPTKIATAFLDSDGKFPEPLITIWEPRAYPVLLQFLGQGYSCPRKVLINSDIELLNAPDIEEFRNVNHPEEKEQAMARFNPGR